MSTLNKAGNPILNLQRDVDAFTRAYIECAFWTDANPDSEEMADKTWLDLADETLARMVADCGKFQADNEDLLALCGDSKQNGHDFWLTRNHHGAGFWDREYSETVSDQITERAHAFGEFSLYVGDDGKVYA